MPGVSGALLAINFKVYDRIVESLVNFFSDWKKNLRFLVELGLGIIIAIILFSNGIRYLLNNYNFLMMMLFMGLIGGGSYNYIRRVSYERREYKYILFIVGLLIGVSFMGQMDSYVISNNFNDNIIEIIAYNVRKYRKINGITQEQLAIDIDVTPEFIRKFESTRGSEGLSLMSLYKISIVLNVSMDKFFEDIDETND